MKVKDLTVTALFAALICAAAPWTVPIGPIPLSLATFAVYLAGATLGAKRGTAAVLVYVLIGAVGLPVFSGFAGGMQKILGVTGGYIVGYIPCALLTGLFADKGGKLWSYAAGMVAGTVALYALGTAWFCFAAKAALAYALSVCVLPFLVGDAIKIACAAFLATQLRPLVNKMNAQKA